MRRACVLSFVNLYACARSNEYRSKNLNSSNVSINDNESCHYDYNYNNYFKRYYYDYYE